LPAMPFVNLMALMEGNLKDNLKPLAAAFKKGKIKIVK